VLTLFTTAKPFKGHDGVIERNALRSWKLLNPDLEVVLFGNEEGASEVCAELGLRFEPKAERHESGAKCLDYMFRRVQQISSNQYFCFANCDIVLMQDFWRAFEKARAWRSQFLLVAQRWDVDIVRPINFTSADWGKSLRERALVKGSQRNEFWIDLFLFRRGMYLDMPPLIVGHCHWDNWMIWKALSESVPVLDATSAVVAVHQNHGYSVASGRSKGFDEDPLSLLNLELIGGWAKRAHIKSSTHALSRSGYIYWNVFRYTYPVTRKITAISYRVWFRFLDATRSVRRPLGLRSGASAQARQRFLVFAVVIAILLWWAWNIFREHVPRWGYY